MVNGIFKKENMTFLYAKEVDYINKDEKRIKGVSLIFEDSNGVEGSFYINEEALENVTYPKKRNVEGTLFVKVSEAKGLAGKSYTKVEYKKFVEEK